MSLLYPLLYGLYSDPEPSSIGPRVCGLAQITAASSDRPPAVHPQLRPTLSAGGPSLPAAAASLCVLTAAGGPDH